MQQSKSTRYLSNGGVIFQMSLLLLLVLIATVASVPTSVLVQNSELSSISNANNAKKINKMNNNKNIVQLSKVKRSSNNNIANEINSATTTDSNANLLEKKSSPEIVPASFNAPAKTAADGTSSQSKYGISNDIVYTLPTNSEIMAAVEAAAVANERELAEQQQQQQQQYYADGQLDETPSLMHKRGINTQQYLYDAGAGLAGFSGGYGGATDYYNNPYLQASTGNYGYSDLPTGIWTDELEPAVVYSDLQELDDYVPAQRAAVSVNNRNKAYDNLQNLLNSESYFETLPAGVVPMQQYTSRYYGAGGGNGAVADTEHNKRGGGVGGGSINVGGNGGGGYYSTTGSSMKKYNNKFADMRLKRDTQLTPADMLALVALVEAGERARKDTDADAGYVYPGDDYAPKTYNPSSVYDYQMPAAVSAPASPVLDETDYNVAGNWLDAPAVVDYYGMPVNVAENIPKYEFIPREHKYAGGNNIYNSGKRFMVAKKKRSLGKFLNEPVAKPGSITYKGEKYF